MGEITIDAFTDQLRRRIGNIHALKHLMQKQGYIDIYMVEIAQIGLLCRSMKETVPNVFLKESMWEETMP